MPNNRGLAALDPVKLPEIQKVTGLHSIRSGLQPTDACQAAAPDQASWQDDHLWNSTNLTAGIT
jgi:hypothetical protein